MSDAPLTGSCLCGAVRFEVRAPFFDAGYCHCTRCQGRTGTGSSVNGLAHAQDVAVVQGEEAIRTWQPEGGFPKSFCGICGAHLFSGVPGGLGVCGIRFGALDGDPGIAPSFHQWTSSAPPWDPIPDDGLTRYSAGRLG
ncbi:MAG TPA: GFA family protein [Conexibacter sp.]